MCQSPNFLHIFTSNCSIFSKKRFLSAFHFFAGLEITNVENPNLGIYFKLINGKEICFLTGQKGEIWIFF